MLQRKFSILSAQACACARRRTKSGVVVSQGNANFIPRCFSSAVASNNGGGPILPSHKRVVIIGGGVIGCSVAYNLAKRGWGSEVILLEQSSLTSGTTWHAAGLIGAARSTEAETRLSVEGIRVVQMVEEETGLSAGYKQCGSVTVARTPDRMIALKRIADRVRAFGLDAEVISPNECGQKYNGLMRTDNIEGGLWLPQDGTGSPTDLTQCYAKGAKSRGVDIREGIRVEKINVSCDSNGNRSITGVVTSDGDTVDAEYVVLCAGQWSKQVGLNAGVNVPLHSAEHYYIITEPIEGVTPDLPVMRDVDAYIYFREWSGGLCMGGFEPDAKPIFDGYKGVPEDFAFSLLPDDHDQFAILYNGSIERVPAMEKAGIHTFLNGPESFTADGHYLLGEAPEVKRMFVCAGMNSSGIASSGGAGSATADWIVDGQPSMDLWPVDIRRHHKRFTSSPKFLKERIAETLGLHYIMPWPRRELKTARRLRRSPLYRELQEAGASFGQRAGWERANYFGDSVEPGTFGNPAYTNHVAHEVSICRNEAAIFDQTSFSKYDVSGRDAAKVMQRLCAANCDVAVGKIVYTGMLNARGGYEADVTVTRTSETSFNVVSATAQSTRDLHWIKGQIYDNEFCVTHDVTSSYAVLSIMGPKSRNILSKCSYSAFDDDSFPFGTAQDVDIGHIMVNARRVTYVGELGWELHIPSEAAVMVYEAIVESSNQVLGCVPLAGYYAIESMRLEKNYRAWGHEIGPDDTPIESGLAFTLGGKAFGTDRCFTGDFIGRDAVLRKMEEREKGMLSKRLVSFTSVMSPRQFNSIPWGGEPLYCNGQLVGRTTSAGVGYHINKALAMGYINHPDAYKKGFLKSAEWEIGIAGEKYAFDASVKAPYDPNNFRLR